MNSGPCENRTAPSTQSRRSTRPSKVRKILEPDFMKSAWDGLGVRQDSVAGLRNARGDAGSLEYAGIPDGFVVPRWTGFELMPQMRVVILGSGRGSNAEAILAAQQAGNLGAAQVVQILSDKP